ncbi:hypothetical protein BDN70DRAFT_878252 [Pholiota conissans]|uniref:Uncharacterized protein n=1 Tax=Pholiota conissans TaxID=109636 RepID=A0A9P5Z2I0_9AGAR|nr:hypothetical protein BDN70DRAFT_878252 [Pholiota conissans]
MVLIPGDTFATYVAIKGLSQLCLSINTLLSDVSPSSSLPASIHRSVTYSIPCGLRTENVCFAVIEDSPSDVLVDMNWLLQKGINSGAFLCLVNNCR